MGFRVSQNYRYHIGGLYNQDYSILESVLGFLCWETTIYELQSKPLKGGLHGGLYSDSWYIIIVYSIV